MRNLASAAPEGKPQPAAAMQISAPWGLLQRLPIRLSDLEPPARNLVGRAVDSGLARLLLDANGAAIVARARP
jgi:hypothetical protein